MEEKERHLHLPCLWLIKQTAVSHGYESNWASNNVTDYTVNSDFNSYTQFLYIIVMKDTKLYYSFANVTE